MILVTLGTQDKKFTRLLSEIQKQIDLGNINEKVVVQAGCTTFKSKDMEIFDLIPITEFDKLVRDCDLLITHGGVGSIITGLNENKKVIVSPRLSKYDEHTNDHQLEITESFEKKGHILAFYENDDLAEVLKKVKTFEPKKYKSNTKKFIKIVEKEIEKYVK